MEGLCESCNVFLLYVPMASRDVTPRNFQINAALQDLETRTRRLSVNVDSLTPGGYTPLLYAAWHGHSQCVKTLINAGASVNRVKGTTWPPLVFSAGGGDCRSVQLLLEAGADVNETDKAYDKTAISMASQMGHDKCIELLLKGGADVNRPAGKGKETALMNAAWAGQEKCVEVLLKGGADVNMVDNSEKTALTKAAGQSQVNCLKILLKAGADVNKGGMAPLMKATIKGNIVCCYMLLQWGADVNKLHASWTALHYAANYGHNEILKLLLNAAADVNTGKNPLAAATACHRTTAAKILVEAGADVNKIDEGSDTILHNSTSYDYSEVLLQADIKINIKNQFGRNALEHYNTRTGTPKEDICMLLFAAGETIGSNTAVDLQQLPLPGFPLHEDLNLCFKHLCRECIRRHLLKLDRHTHLFYRVRKLGLPRALCSYLLYDMAIGDPILADTKQA